MACIQSAEAISCSDFERRSSESWRDAVTKARVRTGSRPIRMTAGGTAVIAWPDGLSSTELAIFSTLAESTGSV